MRTVHHFTKAEKKFIYTLALKFVQKYRDMHAEYERDCESDRDNGYRAHYCEHGTNQWTDYDNICGPCEDGRTLAYGSWKYERALSEAKARFIAADDIMRLHRRLAQSNVGFDSPEIRDLLKTALDENAYFGSY
jgi:hypothetical protein